MDRDFGLLSDLQRMASVLSSFSLSMFADIHAFNSTAALKISNSYTSCCLVLLKAVIQTRVISKQLSAHPVHVNNVAQLKLYREKKRTGPGTESCGIPHLRWILSEDDIFTWTNRVILLPFNVQLQKVESSDI